MPPRRARPGMMDDALVPHPRETTPMTRIVIIGGGPAGYEAALVAAQLGAEVTVVERDGIGGASVLTDCVPSKTLIAAAGAMTAVRDSAGLALQGRQLTEIDLVLAKANHRAQELAP